MKERARKYSQALKPSLIKALKQYQTTIIATHVPPYERAAWHEGSPSSPDYQPFFSSPTMGNMIKAAAAEHPGDMTKTELQVALATATETNKRTAGVFLDTLSALAYKEIKKNGEFVLPGLCQRSVKTGH